VCLLVQNGLRTLLGGGALGGGGADRSYCPGRHTPSVRHCDIRALHGPKFHGPARPGPCFTRPGPFLFLRYKARPGPARSLFRPGPARPVMFSAIVARPGPFTFSLNGLYYRIPTNKNIYYLIYTVNATDINRLIQ
jgi:hypothetical protein